LSLSEIKMDISSKDHVEDAVLAAYDRYAQSVSEVIADRCALTFREGFLSGHAEAEAELRAENARLRTAAQAVIDSINDENEIDPDAVYRLSQALDRPKCRP